MGRRMRVVLATAAALIAFAANSLLCRAALGGGHADAASFTLVRLASGAAVLLLLSRGMGGARGGSWPSAAALFVYAAAFSFAYFFLSAGVGALLLFGAVQVTMIGAGIAAGERPPPLVWAGLTLALGGLVHLSLRGARAPSPGGTALMLAAGVAWGVYSLRGRRAGPPLPATADNFRRAAPLAALVWMVAALAGAIHLTPVGAVLAIGSGAVTSGLGYVAWYSALPHLTATRAAVLQLSVPVLAASGGVVLLGEVLTGRLLVAGTAILIGIALATMGRGSAPGTSLASRRPTDHTPAASAPRAGNAS
jgi:drug/metabolite transporter (DMT)-like permease